MATHDPPGTLTLEDLSTASAASLRKHFADVFDRQPPRWASADFLRGNLAWHLQAHRSGQSPAATRERLVQRAKAMRSRPPRTHAAGTRLVREWQGRTYEVMILDKGYHWQGRRYTSLSRIAREITGTRWSGPRFFGLKETG